MLGFPTLRDYETKGAEGGLYFGAILGRYANWIARGRFTLDGREHQVPLAYPPHAIHGGKKGFDKRVWTVQPQAVSGGSVSARLTYISPDGEEGFPGTLQVGVTYALSEDGAFTIHYEAVTDKATVITLSNHMNFNLAGAGSPGGVLGQVLTVDADKYLPLDKGQLPLGPLAPVAGTPFDFRTPAAIGARIHDKHEQLAIADGYDQYWVLDKPGDPARPQHAVRAYDPGSGRTLDCWTTEPGVQIYTAGYFDGSYTGTGGRYGKYAAFTLETHHFPDSPNHPAFPTTELRPGQGYGSTTTFRLGVNRGRYARAEARGGFRTTSRQTSWLSWLKPTRHTERGQVRSPFKPLIEPHPSARLLRPGRPCCLAGPPLPRGGRRSCRAPGRTAARACRPRSRHGPGQG